MNHKLLVAASGVALVSAVAVSCNLDSRDFEGSLPVIGGGALLPDGGGASGGPDAAAQLSVDPASIDFGAAVVGTPSRARLAVVNSGNAPLATPLVSTVAGSDPDFIILHNQCENSVGPAERCYVRMQLLAAEAGPSSGTLRVEGNGQSADVPLAGSALAAGPLTLAPTAGSSADFGGVVLAASAEAQFDVSNPTASPSGALSFSVNEAQFQLLPPAAGDCQPGSTALVNGQTCRIRVAYSPSRRGPVDASLLVTAESLGSTSLPLAGTGRSPATLEVPGSVDFGGVVTGTAGQRTLRIHNSGDEPAELSGVTLSGLGSAMGEPTTPEGSAFSVQNSECGTGMVLAGGASCSVTTAFRPLTVVADQRAQLVVAVAGGAQQTIELSGSGLALGALSISPAPDASRDFGELPVGQSATQVFVVTNPSAQPSGVLNLQVSEGFALVPGSAKGDCNSAVTSLVNGQSCAVAVTFTPSERGQKDGGLTVASPLAGAANLALTGRGLSAPQLTLARDELDFGRVPTQTPVRQTLTLLNSGDQPIAAVQASLEAPGGGPAVGFSLQSSCEGPVGANAVCEIAVEFLPAEASAYSAVLRLGSDSGEAASALLLGRAFPRGSLVLTPVAGATDFGDVAIGVPRTLEFTLTNPGNVPSGRLTITTTSPLFSLDPGDCNPEGGAGLANGQSCTFSVTFNPVGSEQVAANLSVQSPGAGETATPLSGRGRVAPDLNATGTRDFGVATINEATLNEGNQFTWTVTNDGDLASGPLQLTNTNGSEFVVSNDTCTNVSVPGRGSCSLDVLFRPSTGGPKSANLTLTDSTTLEVLQLVMTGTGLVVAQPGQSCLNGEACATGECTAGVCCDRACAGSCQECSTTGVCADQAERQACGDGNGRCFGVDRCLLPELLACSGDDQCGDGNCEPRLGGAGPNDRICCLDDCGATGQQCNPQTGRCQVPDLAQGASCGAAGQPQCGAGLECKACRGGGNQCTPPDGCCGGCGAGYVCNAGECGCPSSATGGAQIDCGGGVCIPNREFACCVDTPECPQARPVCNGAQGLCVQCLSNADCGPCSTCSGNNTCTPVARGQAGGCGGGMLCNGSGACFAPQCTGVGQCGDCRTCSDFACVNAGAGATCSTGVCTGQQRCVQCIADAQCSAAQHCDLPSNTCVANCVPATEVCDGRDNDCDGQVDENATTEVCDGRDNDCDGQVDDGFDFQGDENNCGSCGNRCPAGNSCNAGRCVPDAPPPPTVLCDGRRIEVSANQFCCNTRDTSPGSDAIPFETVVNSIVQCPPSNLDVGGVMTTPITCDDNTDCTGGEVCCLTGVEVSSIECMSPAECNNGFASALCSSPQGDLGVSCPAGTSCQPHFLVSFSNAWQFCQF